MRTLCPWAAAGLSTGHNGPPDSHPRHRPGAPPHRLGSDRGRRQSPDVHGLRQVVSDHLPDEAAVEATFVSKDGSATLKLGQARGIAMLVPAIAGLPVAEYAPNLVKKTIVGAGHCEKAQIRMMIGVLLPKADPASDDAADALAIAVCHAHHRQSAALRVAAP